MADAHNNSSRSPHGSQYLVSVTIVLAFLIFATVLYSLYVGNHMSTVYHPQRIAIKMIKLEIALANLCLEEIIGGDSNKNISTVWQHMDRCRHHGRSLLKSDHIPRSDVEDVLQQISYFRTMAEQRLANISRSDNATGMTEHFDAVFNSVLEKTDEIEKTIDLDGAKELQLFQTVQYLLIVLCLGSSIITGIVFLRYKRWRLSSTKELLQYASIVSSSTDMIAVLDTNFVYLTTNEAYLAAFGMNKDQVVGHTVSQVFGKEFFETIIKPNAGRCLEGNKVNCEDWFEFPVHGLRFMSTNYAPFIGTDGDINGFVVNGRDITERKQAVQKAHMHQLEVAHISRVNSIGEMASSLAHEINQPLCVMLAQAERSEKLLKSGSQNIDTVIDKMQIIVKQADRANKIISRIREHVHKGTSGKQIVSLNALVDNSLELLQIEVRQKMIKLQLDLSDDVLDVNVDAVQVEQVIVNLINNSIDALDETPEDKRYLLIKTTEAQGNAQLRISDSGMGMDPDEVHSAFDSFYTTKTDGLGIGLSISRSIIESLGGRIGLQANDSNGMTSYFSLPVHKVN